MKIYKKRNKGGKGFTLIELLIVMSIIGLMAAISIFALQNARKSGLDAKRKSDLETIRQALEFYRSDCGVYPGSVTSGGTIGPGPAPCNNTYLSSVPYDPDGTTPYRYVAIGSPVTDYCLCTKLDIVPAVTSNCTGFAACHYKVESP